MAPYAFANYDTGEMKPVILYNEYRQNEELTTSIPPMQNNNSGAENQKTDVFKQLGSESAAVLGKKNTQTLSEQTGAANGSEKAENQRPFQIGDKVVVKHMDIKQMKKLQKNHGEWNPKMEQAMGKCGIVVHIFPDGDLCLLMETTMIHCIFNPECVIPLEQSTTPTELSTIHQFKKGEKARVKDLPTDMMKKLQATSGGWLPIMEDIKNRLCIVKGSQFGRLFVTMMNGLCFHMNPSLLEKVDQDVDEEQHERCYRKGDTVEIRNIKQEQLKQLFEKYGFKPDANVLQARNKTGKVVRVAKGRSILVHLDNEEFVHCCPPILELKTETSDIDTGDDEENALVEFYENSFNVGPQLGPTLIDILRPMFPSGMPSDVKHLVLKTFESMNEALLKVFQGAEDRRENRRVTQSQTFQEGDLVLVRNMDVAEIQKKQETHGGYNPMMITALGKHGRVVRIFPSGDLHIMMEDTLTMWYFNPECVLLVAKFEQHCFEKGQKVRFKNLSTEEMMRLQEHHGGWVPLMEDMKIKLCTIQKYLAYQLEVKMIDGYVWVVNPKLVEPVAEEVHEEQGGRCYKKGDIVKIKDLTRDEMKKRNKHHGIGWDSEIFHSKQLRGEVIGVLNGRIVNIKMEDGKVLSCCRPILDLEEESKEEYDDASEERNISRQIKEVQQRMTSGVIQEVSISQGPSGIKVNVSVVFTPLDLLRATAAGNVDNTNAILQKHPHWIDAISGEGHHTALMNACSAGSMDIVKILVEAGARIDMDNIDGNTSVIVAAWKGERNILEFLLEKGAMLGVTNSNGQNALHAAILSNSEECVGLLLKRCSTRDFHAQANDGMTPVMLAIKMKNPNICKLIFDSTHFKASSVDKHGFTALHAAAIVGNEYATKILLDMHPQGINQQKHDMWTPLHLAAFNNRTDVLKLLLAHKNCDKNILNEDKETPISLAVKGCLREVVDLLLESGADTNIQNEDGNTCLHQIFKLREKSVCEPTLFGQNTLETLPSQKQWLDLARLLISKGASVDVFNNNGDKPLDYIKDDTVKAEILTEIEAGISIKNNLEDFKIRLQYLNDADRVKQVYQTSTFAARYFDDKGGYLEIEKADVRLYIPPGAVNQTEQLVYINLDPVNHEVRGKVSPVVQVGPPGTNFKKKITLSYPHCAVDESKWKFSTLTSEDPDAKVTDWKNVNNEEGVESRVKNGRTIIKTSHFTRYLTTGEPVTEETVAQKNMRIGAFGKDYTQGTSSYQVRVRTWEDTDASRQIVLAKELGYLKTKPIDDDRPLLVRNTHKDVFVKVNDLKIGWQLRKGGAEQHLKFDHVWHNKHPSCTVDLDRSEGSASGTTSENVHCSIKAKQIEAPDEDLVHLSISLEAIICEEEPSTKRTMKEDLYGPTPDIPNMPKELYLDLCGILNREDDVNGDWRTVMSAMDMGDVTTIANTRNLKSNKDSPANFALRSYLLQCRAEGSNNPIGDLLEIFKKNQLYEALQCVQNYMQLDLDLD